MPENATIEGMKKIKLIACDLDGTLLLNGAQVLEKDTCELIAALLDRGVCFYAASGRQYPNLCDLFAPVKDRIGYICENGTVVIEGDVCLKKSVLDRDTALKIAEEADARPEYEVLVSGERTGYIRPKSDYYYHYLKDEVKDRLALVNDFGDVPEEIVKVSIFEKEGRIDDDCWKERYGKTLSVTRGERRWLDLFCKGADKASALSFVCERLQIQPAECMAIGDGENDMGMLKFAGCAVAMENARESLKEIADLRIKKAEDFFCSLLQGRDDLTLPL